MDPDSRNWDLRSQDQIIAELSRPASTPPPGKSGTAAATGATPDNPTCERCGRIKSEHDETDSDSVLCPDIGRLEFFRRRPIDMPRHGTAPHPDVPLGCYRHYKQEDGTPPQYEVTGGALMATGKEDTVLVVYRKVKVYGEQGYQCVRTVDDWRAEVTWSDGTKGPRFRKDDR